MGQGPAPTHQSLLCTAHVALVPDLDLTLLEATGPGTLLSLLQRLLRTADQ